MHVASHGPQEILCLAKLQILLAREQAFLDEFSPVIELVEILADPEKRMQIAQTTLAVFDIGLHEIA